MKFTKNFFKHLGLCFVVNLLVSLLFLSCKKEALPAQTQLHLGTVCTINLFESGTTDLYSQMFQRLKAIEHVFSVKLPHSALSQVNQAAGIAPVTVPQEVIYVLQEALRIAQRTGGAFDPTIGPLVDLWDIGGDNSQVPSQEAIKRAISLVDWRLVELDVEACTVFLPKEGMALDLGGIAKGFAADQLVLMAQEAGVQRALFDLGGNIYAFGTKEDGTPWRVGVKNPQSPTAEPALAVAVKDSSVVTSGMYERFFEQDGIRYHHILNPATGFPVWNDVQSVTILCKNSMLADALSTSVFILGQEKGLQLLEAEDAEGVVISAENMVYPTSGITNQLTVVSPLYQLAE